MHVLVRGMHVLVRGMHVLVRGMHVLVPYACGYVRACMC